MKPQREQLRELKRGAAALRVNEAAGVTATGLAMTETREEAR